MRILVVAHAFPPEGCGGTERYAEAAARGLLARGHEVAVFSGSLEWREQLELVRSVEDGLPVLRVHRNDLFFDHWDKGAHPRVARAFEEEIARFRPDVVHLHQWIRLSHDLVRRAAAAKVPTLIHLHDFMVTCPRVFRVRPDPKTGTPHAAASEQVVVCDEPLGRAACTTCVPRWKFQDDATTGRSLDEYAAAFAAELAAATALVAPLRAHALRVASLAPRPGLKIDALAHPRLPGGIEGPGTDAKSPAGRLRLLYFSHLLPMKGPHVVLAAMKQLAEAASDGMCGVSLDAHGGFGSPEYEARLRELARGLEVRFHGPYAKDEPAKTPADVAIVPTLARESWSFWLDEAARLGLPIVAADSGAIAERATGRMRLYPARDFAALARLLAELRDDPAARRRLAEAPAPQAPSLEAHLAELEQRLADAVAKGAPPIAPLPPTASFEAEFDRRERDFFEKLQRGDGS